MQGDIDGGLGGGVAGGEGVDGGENFPELKRIGKTAEVDPREKRGGGGLAFAKIRRHRGLAVTDDPFVFDLDQHFGRGSARSGGDGECVAQFGGVGCEAENHPESRATAKEDRERRLNSSAGERRAGVGVFGRENTLAGTRPPPKVRRSVLVPIV